MDDVYVYNFSLNLLPMWAVVIYSIHCSH